jgi:glycosyltransferase involved in cell wall biosynthesis
MAARLAGVSFCVNGEHGVLHLTKTRQYYLQKLTFTMFDDVLTVSYGLKEKLIRRFELHPDVIRVIPNGVDAERFSGSYPVDSLKRDLGLVANEFVIGVIGTLKKQKNQSLVLEAIRSIQE